MNPTDNHRMRAVTLQDKYSAEEGVFFMTGNQALVRLPIQQRLRDAAAGHQTGGYISGYRGSPLGGYDMALWSASEALARHDIHFRPGLNEELAATAISGSQYLGMFPGSRVEGVFGIWYGKGPGVDRASDALRHGNWAGTSALGGVLVLAGDDHGGKSSSITCYSDTVIEAVGMPLLYPGNVQEIIDLGLHGFAMSRHSGAWVGMKLVTDVVESGAPVYVGPGLPSIVRPDDHQVPPQELSIRPFELVLLPQEERIYHHRLYAVLAYARANGLNRIVRDEPDARIGIVSAGKAFYDVTQALANLRVDDGRRRPPMRVLKVGMVWPLDPEIVRQFARGLNTIIVVEEKRPNLENQIRAILYGAQKAPRLVGKLADQYLFDRERGPFVIPNFGETNPTMIAAVLAEEFHRIDPASDLQVPGCSPASSSIPAVMRTPSYCSGCPHNRSTRLPEGSRGLAGIGCHGMAVLLDPKNYRSISQMGGEGIQWLGQQPFTSEKHVFANIGDGTYAHSGMLAIRQAVAAHVPITYKLLYNGFVSMTGGQPVEGGQTVPQIVQSLTAEGVKKIALVTDDPDKYRSVALPDGVEVLHRSKLEAVQRQLREYADVSVIVYDQPCAAERRRLRKKGKWEDPPKRTFINSAVCEGCGDCGKVSTCLSIEPLDTELGRKRRINQSSCNKDFTCVEGFCPSFVTVYGADLRKAAKPRNTQSLPTPPEPTLPDVVGGFNILVCGIGGTGIVTVGQVLSMAAHLEGLHCSSLDVMGMAQKYGAVLSHVRIATRADDIHASRIGVGETDTLIGCDLIVASGNEVVGTLSRGRSRGVICADVISTAEFARNPDWAVDPAALVGRVRERTNQEMFVLDGQRLATQLMGDAIAANMFMVGVAWQKGQIPLSLAAIDRAIELNGVAVDMNREAFLWGRRAAHDLKAVEVALRPGKVIEFTRRRARSLDDVVKYREDYLRAYQGEALSRRYTRLVERVRDAEARAGLGEELAMAVAKGYFKLLMVKDEWEVARLYSLPEFKQELDKTFQHGYRLHFHIGSWPFARRDPATGALAKREVSSWLWSVFRVMSKLRFVRGSLLDPFRYGAERKLDRQLLAQYEADVEKLIEELSAENHRAAVALALLPEKIRGYGHVKKAHADQAERERRTLLVELQAARVRPARQATTGLAV
jgi:indolepyruvate ferredoxin oxidoreductase